MKILQVTEAWMPMLNYWAMLEQVSVACCCYFPWPYCTTYYTRTASCAVLHPRSPSHFCTSRGFPRPSHNRTLAASNISPTADAPQTLKQKREKNRTPHKPWNLRTTSGGESTTIELTNSRSFCNQMPYPRQSIKLSITKRKKKIVGNQTWFFKTTLSETSPLHTLVIFYRKNFSKLQKIACKQAEKSSVLRASALSSLLSLSCSRLRSLASFLEEACRLRPACNTGDKTKRK